MGGAEKEKRTPCTWEELSKHNSDNDCWVAIDGKVYDVTKWVDKHPGGRDVLTLTAGRDCTNLFESYHPFTEKPSLVLKQYYVCDMESTELPRYVQKSKFYATLSRRVRDHFEKKGIDHKNGWRMWARYAYVYAGLLLSYYLLFFCSTSRLALFASSLLFGYFTAMLGLHNMHDAGHCAITHKPAAWRWVGATFDILIGASFFAWLHQHVIGHHVYTNVRGADPDLGEGDYDFRVVAPGQKRFWIHKFQWLYAPLLYGLLTVKYRLQDKDNFTVRTNGRIRVEQASLHHFLVFVIGKLLYISTRFGVPLYMGWDFSTLFFATIITEFLAGYYLAFNFQVSHVATDLTVMVNEGNDPIDEDWAKLQVLTTQDYAHGNWWTTLNAGALNYQVVHHLYPSVNQTYYPEIAPIVLETCKEFGIKYQVLPSFSAALYSHIDYLRIMGEGKPTKGD